MAKIACYTPEGEVRMKEPVDARECVENLGFTMDDPLSIKDAGAQVVDSINNAAGRLDISKFLKPALIELAELHDIELDGDETKAVLIKKIEAFKEGK